MCRWTTHSPALKLVPAWVRHHTCRVHCRLNIGLSGILIKMKTYNSGEKRVFLLPFLFVGFRCFHRLGVTGSQPRRSPYVFLDDYFPTVLWCKHRFIGEGSFGLLLFKTNYWHCKGWKTNKVAKEILFMVWGLCKFLHFLNEYMAALPRWRWLIRRPVPQHRI